MQRANQITSKIFNLPSAYVSKTEEEEDSNESDNAPSHNRRGNKRQVKVMSLGHLSQLINKQIYSDDFDKESFKTELSKRYKRRIGGPQSMLDQPIDEDEYEHLHDDYLSDTSSNSSQFSLRKRYLSLDLQKLIDKLEPMDDSSAVHSKYYQANVNETIEEEISDHDEEFDKKSQNRFQPFCI